MQPAYSSNPVIRHEDYLIAQGPSSYCLRSSRILSCICRPAASNDKRKPSLLPTEGRIELDSHADTIILGANCVILSHTGQTCVVMPYSDTYKAITDVPVVTRATLWTSLHDGDEYILIFNEDLWMGDTLQHTLVNPNHLQAYGTTVQDNPFSPSPLSFDPTNGPVIPLTAMGTIIYCTTRAPSDHELSYLPQIILSSSATWDPHNVVFLSNCVEGGEHGTHISSISSSTHDLTSTIHDPATFHSRPVSSIQVHAPSKSPEELPTAPTFQSKSRHSSVTPEDLSERWLIGLKRAKDTIQNTTQRILRSALLPLARRYRADHMYEWPRVRCVAYTDTMDGQHKSLDGNKFAQVFATDFCFSAVYPMESNGHAGDALKQFITYFGVPDKIGSKEQTKRGIIFMEQVRKHHIDLHTTEPHRHNQSKVEGVIRELRKNWFRTIHRKQVPKRLWDYGLQWVSEVRVRTSSDAVDLRNRTPLERVTGDTVDISEYLEFGFYDWCWYHKNARLGPTKLGRWLGVAHRVGGLVSYWVLTINSTVIARTTVQQGTSLEMQQGHMKEWILAFDETIRDKIKDSDHSILEGGKTQPHDWNDHPFEDDPDLTEEFHGVESRNEVKEADETFTPNV